jgi:type IX secretion system PorP/SprF family membrane protein
MNKYIIKHQNMKIKTLSCIVFLILLYQSNYGQNFYSEYYTAPLLLNPANTGNFTGTYRASGVHVKQLNALTQISNNAFSCDIKLPLSSLPENDRLAIGLAAFSEKDAYNGVKNSYYLLSMAYHKALNGEGTQMLGVGFQAGFAHRKITPPQYVFPSQVSNWLSYGFFGVDPLQGTVVDIGYIDLNAGLTYQNQLSSKNQLNVGISLLHANQPQKKIAGGSFSLLPEIGLQAGLTTSFSNNSRLYSHFTFTGSTKQKQPSNLSAGCIYQLSINQSKYSINAGGLYRKNKLHDTVLLPCFGLKYNGFNLLLLYSINVSANTAAPRGGLEVGMVFTGYKSFKN